MRSCPDTDIDSKSERSVKDAGVRKPGTGALHKKQQKCSTFKYDFILILYVYVWF